MAIFLLFGVLACSAIIFVYVFEKSRLNEGEPQQYTIIRLTNAIYIHVHKGVSIVFPYLILFLIFLLYSVIVIYQRVSTDPINSIRDYLTSHDAARALLGLIFGVLLAAWIINLLRKRDNQDFTLGQRAGGVALAGLFILGTTSIGVDDLLRAFKIGPTGVGFDLPAAPASQTKGSDITTTPGSGPGREGGPEPVDRRWGMETLTTLHISMQRDGRLLSGDGANPGPVDCDGLIHTRQKSEQARELHTAAEAYRCKFSRIAACLSAVVAATRDENYLVSALSDLRPPVRELHLLSLAKKATDAAHSTMPSEKLILARLTILKHKLLNHSRSIAPGLRALHGDDSSIVSSIEKSCESMPSGFGDYSVISIGIEDRPYLTILYSALLQLGEQELAAVDAIEDWIAINKPAPKSIYYFRAKLSQYQIMERFFRRVSEPTDSTIERFMRISSDLTSTLRSIADVEKTYEDAFFKKKLNLVEEKFSSMRLLSDMVCKHPVNDRLILGFTLYNVEVVSSRRSLQHTKFADKYFRSATDTLTRTIEADPSCFPALFNDNVKGAITQAETLIVYARFKARTGSLRKSLSPRHPELVEKDLEIAQSALHMARNLVEAAIDSAGLVPRAASNGQELLDSVDALNVEYQGHLDRLR